MVSRKVEPQTYWFPHLDMVRTGGDGSVRRTDTATLRMTESRGCLKWKGSRTGPPTSHGMRSQGGRSNVHTEGLSAKRGGGRREAGTASRDWEDGEGSDDPDAKGPLTGRFSLAVGWEATSHRNRRIPGNRRDPWF